MTMNMLGAETGHLETLGAQLGSTALEIEVVKGSTQSTADRVVNEISASFTAAVSGIEQHMSVLQSAVAAAKNQLASTTWTGANALHFHDGYDQFSAAMGGFEGAVRAAYSQFNEQMLAVSATIAEFQVQVAASMTEAQGSVEGMRSAVVSQQQNLEAAMNTGITFG